MNNKSEHDELKGLIIEANNAYRMGRPIMSDDYYDHLLLDEFKSKYPDEYNEFRKSLHEQPGKVLHPYIMGSLEKIKSEDIVSLGKFLDLIKGKETELVASRKVDGISCRLHYSKGEFVSASTRGDGYYGEDITDKVKVILTKRHLINIPFQQELDIRGELVIKDSPIALDSDFDRLNDCRIANNEKTFTAKRNAVAGLFGQKTWNPEEIGCVSFIAYTILGSEMGKLKDLDFLSGLGFEIVDFHVLDIRNISSMMDFAQSLNNTIEEFDKTCDYEADGLVLCGANFYGEDDVYLPEKMMAYKLNTQSAETQIVNVDWGLPSKDGTLCPVAILKPISLGGVTIERATLHNMDFICKKNIKINSIVQIVRSGDVIPYVEKVVSIPDNAYDIIPPMECPSCGEPVSCDGVFVRCENPECPEKQIQIACAFLEKVGIKGFRSELIRTWGIKGIKDMVDFVPSPERKQQVSFRQAIDSTMMTKSERELFTALNFKGLSTNLLTQIIDFYGFKNVKEQPISMLVKDKGYPPNIGPTRIEQFLSCLGENLDILDTIVSSPNYSGKKAEDEAAEQSTPMNNYKGSICVTGKLNFGSRDAFIKMAEKHGYTAKTSVIKGLDYLITNDANSGSSKNKKAKLLGIKVITEEEFMKMLATSPTSGVIDTINDNGNAPVESTTVLANESKPHLPTPQTISDVDELIGISRDSVEKYIGETCKEGTCKKEPNEAKPQMDKVSAAFNMFKIVCDPFLRQTIEEAANKLSPEEREVMNSLWK